MYNNETPNYDLPQFVESDTLNIVSDLNPAFETIDRVMKENAVNATSAINLVQDTAANAQSAATDANRALNNAQAAAMSAQKAQEAAESVTTPLQNVTTRVSELEQSSVSDENRLQELESNVTNLENEDDLIRAEFAADVQNLQTNINQATNLAQTAKTAADNALSVAESAVNMSHVVSVEEYTTTQSQSNDNITYHVSDVVTYGDVIDIELVAPITNTIGNNPLELVFRGTFVKYGDFLFSKGAASMFETDSGKFSYNLCMADIVLTSSDITITVHAQKTYYVVSGNGTVNIRRLHTNVQ